MTRSTSGHVVVVGPRLDAKGGIAVVNGTYAAAGLFDGAADGLAIRYFPSTRDGSHALKLAYALARLAAFAAMRLPRPAVVHLHTTWHASFWRKAAYARLARLKGARVVHHIHAFGFLDYYERGGAFRRHMMRVTLRRADALIALTESMAARLRAIAPDPSIVVLPNPLDLAGLRAEPAPSRDPNLVAFLGWFIAEKGIFELLDAFAAARSRVPALRLALGGCRNEDAVRARIRALALDDHVDLQGWLDRRAVGALLHRCAVLALPSHMEGFGLVLVEAMACGAAIVTCPVGGIPEVVQSPRNAIFVPPGDTAALASAIVDLIRSPDLREAMAAAGIREAERYEGTRIVARLKSLYRGVLSGERAAS